MANFTEYTDFEAWRQICDIRETDSLAGFLLPGDSLCVIHRPEWRTFRELERIDGRVRLVTVRGHDRQGEPDELLLGICGSEEQGYYRHKLDKNLKSPFLFASWKHEAHEFRLIRERQTIACFSALEEALAAYLPGEFVPEYSIEQKASAEEQVSDPESLNIGEGLIE